MWPNSERQLSLVEGGIRHLGDAVATGRASKAVFDELYKEEVVKKGLAEQLPTWIRLTRGVLAEREGFEPSVEVLAPTTV